MGYSKRQFVLAAFEETGLASYAFDLNPAQIESGVRRLDTMMAEWNARGVRLGYPLPNSPQFTDIDAESNVPDSANEAIITNLAIRIAPSYGRALSVDTKITAKTSFNTLLARATMPKEMQPHGDLPRGAGQKSIDQPFISSPDTTVDAGPDGQIDLY